MKKIIPAAVSVRKTAQKYLLTAGAAALTLFNACKKNSSDVCTPAQEATAAAAADLRTQENAYRKVRADSAASWSYYDGVFNAIRPDVPLETLIDTIRKDKEAISVLLGYYPSREGRLTPVLDQGNKTMTAYDFLAEMQKQQAAACE